MTQTQYSWILGIPAQTYSNFDWSLGIPLVHQERVEEEEKILHLDPGPHLHSRAIFLPTFKRAWG